MFDDNLGKPQRVKKPAFLSPFIWILSTCAQCLRSRKWFEPFLRFTVEIVDSVYLRLFSMGPCIIFVKCAYLFVSLVHFKSWC
jgi:hypothetical protein